MQVICRWCHINNCKRFHCQQFGNFNMMTNIVAEELPRISRIPETIEVDEEKIATTSDFSTNKLISEKKFTAKDLLIYQKNPLRHSKLHKNYHNKETIFIRNIREARNPCWLKRPSLSTIRKTTNRGRNIGVTLRKNYIKDVFEFVRNGTKIYNNYHLYDIEEECDEYIQKSERDIESYKTFPNQVVNPASPKIVELDEHGNEIVNTSVTSSINDFKNLSLESGNDGMWQNHKYIKLSKNSDNYNNLLDFRENMLICSLQSLHIPDKKNGSLVTERNCFESSIDTITEELIKALDMSQ